MLSAQNYLNLVNVRGQAGKELKRVYRHLRRIDLFVAAYGKLYANRGAMTKGADPHDTIDGMSLEQIDHIITALATGTHRWQPNRRVTIPKANGKRRPLGIPGWRDKLLQEVMRMVLEAYYEPQFSPHSHGFRPQRGCHTALTEIVTTWGGTKWFIEGDIKGCFDNINHTVLLGLVAEKIKDNRLLKLIRELLAAGYLEKWQYHRTFSGTPQGGVVSPLLANIYLHELDQFIEHELMPDYNRGVKRASNGTYGKGCRAKARAKANGDITEHRRLTRQLQEIPTVDPTDPNYRRLKYVRYADDFILGFAGPQAEAEEIKARIRQFLAERLQLELSADKTLITHAQTQPARFLGYRLHIAQDDRKLTKTTKGGVKRRSINGLPLLSVPPEVKQQWLTEFMAADEPAPRPALLTWPDYDIVVWYEAQWRGLANYYTMAINCSALNYVRHILERSLVKTLASKHRCSVKQIYRRYRYKPPDGVQGIRVTVHREDKPPLQATFGTIPVHYRRRVTTLNDHRYTPILKTTELSTRLYNNQCELCGADEHIEVHHIRKLKDLRAQYRRGEMPAWVVTMIAIRRKTLVVCRSCHRQIHAGVYDGPRFD
ncbi:MAG: maturase [Anaerolineales bacterium]|nr:maturase [Anaerolineales bacterium]